jgi:hypothetical protein
MSRNHTKAYVCSHVFDASRPILLVALEEDGWQLLCGDEHDYILDPPKVVGLDHLLERDPSLAELLDLKVGWQAEREGESATWRRAPLEPENAEL